MPDPETPCAEPTPADPPTDCAACGQPVDAAGGYSIHRDGFGEGPEVPLCNACGQYPTPTCKELWASIRQRRISAGEPVDEDDTCPEPGWISDPLFGCEGTDE